MRIGHLPQEVVIGEETGTVLDYLQEGRPIGRLQEELNLVYQKLESAGDQEQTRLLKRMDQLQSQLEYYDCYEAGHILLTIIERMGIDIDLLDMPINRLSGARNPRLPLPASCTQSLKSCFWTNHQSFGRRNKRVCN